MHRAPRQTPCPQSQSRHRTTPFRCRTGWIGHSRLVASGANAVRSVRSRESEVWRRRPKRMSTQPAGSPSERTSQQWDRQISESRSDDLTPESETLLFRRGSRGTRPDGQTLCSQNPTFTLYFSQCPKFRLSSLTTALVRLALRLFALCAFFLLPGASFFPRRVFCLALPSRLFLFHLITARSLRALRVLCPPFLSPLHFTSRVI